jgi:hypothetical protein
MTCKSSMDVGRGQKFTVYGHPIHPPPSGLKKDGTVLQDGRDSWQHYFYIPSISRTRQCFALSALHGYGATWSSGGTDFGLHQWGGCLRHTCLVQTRGCECRCRLFCNYPDLVVADSVILQWSVLHNVFARLRSWNTRTMYDVTAILAALTIRFWNGPIWWDTIFWRM